mmetsp:Transcript_27266/g.78303  ORF Transcript_27266/g.78303 Transcript_27266/m.78303 type:complete len:314 (+) Transcript_27266:2879-3820(+)
MVLRVWLVATSCCTHDLDVLTAQEVEQRPSSILHLPNGDGLGKPHGHLCTCVQLLQADHYLVLSVGRGAQLHREAQTPFRPATLAMHPHGELATTRAGGPEEGVAAPEDEAAAAHSIHLPRHELLRVRVRPHGHALPHQQVVALPVQGLVLLGSHHEAERVWPCVLLVVSSKLELHDAWIGSALWNVDSVGLLFDREAYKVLQLPLARVALVASPDELLQPTRHGDVDGLAGVLLLLLQLLQHLCGVEAALVLRLPAVHLHDGGIAVALPVVLPARGLVRERLVRVLELDEDAIVLLLLLLSHPSCLVRVVDE